jgi:hypothetical protein
VKESQLKKFKHDKESKDNYLDEYYEDKKAVIRRQEYAGKQINLENDRRRDV